MPPPPKLLVEVLSGHNSPWSGEFSKEEISVGRDPACDVRLHPTKDTLSASRIHFRILNTDQGIVVACDHANGVTLNSDHGRQFMEAGHRAPLTSGGEITIGADGPRISVHSLNGPLPGTLRGRGVVGKRENAQPVARLPGDVIHTARSGRRLGLIGLALLALVITCGAFWAWRNENHLAELKRHRSAELDRLISEQQSIRAAISRKPPSESLQEALRTAGASVLLMGSDKQGTFEPAGTAWVAAPGKLITNAHVAQRLEADKAAGARTLARRPGEADLEITSIELHPAFLPWLDLLSQAAVKSGAGESAVNMIAIADLAIVTVKGEAGRPLTIADSADPPAVGDIAGYVGFPTEGLAGVPTMQTVIGSITAITDPFFTRATGRDGLLIHMSGFATGGASGSPIIDARGRVIAVLSAGNVLTVGEGASTRRIPFGLNYGQGVEFVRELLNGTADAAQSSRDPAWRQRMAQVFVAPEQRLESRAAELAATLHDKPEPVSEQEVSLPSSGFRTNIHLDPGFHYIFLAASRDWGDLTLAVGSGGTADDWWKSDRAVVTAVLKAAPEGRTIDLVLNAPRPGGAATAAKLRVLRFKG